MGKGEIKYQYAYDENGNRICIRQLTASTKHDHTYTCINCGNKMVANIGDVNQPYFSHAINCACSGESYLHKLAKILIKEKYDNSSSFNIEYYVTLDCKNTHCKYRKNFCKETNVPHKVDLKKYYDTCEIEAPVKGFIADILLTNSKNPSIEPTLFEVCVTHSCDEVKRNSGLKIIELKIKEEKDITNLAKTIVIRETTPLQKKKEVECISFAREIITNRIVKLHRYIYLHQQPYEGYFTMIDCDKTNNRLRGDSLIELNIFNKNYYEKDISRYIPLRWMNKNKGVRNCCLCKFYYATPNEDYPICRLSKKYGTPEQPELNEAENCYHFHPSNEYRNVFKLDDYYVEEVPTSPTSMKEVYKVIVIASKTFNNYNLYEEKVSYFLSKKLETHTVVVYTGLSKNIDAYTELLSCKLGFLTEPQKPNWDKYKRDAIKFSNEEITDKADALIALWDGNESIVKSLIDLAKSKGRKVAEVNYLNI